MKTNPYILLGILYTILGARVLAAPANDLFENRTLLAGTNLVVLSDNFGASTEPGEDTGSGDSLWFNSVWYSWTSPASGVARWTCVQDGFAFPNVGFRVFRGTAVDALTLVPILPDGGVPVTPGDTLAIEVAASRVPRTGRFVLSLTLLPLEPNDMFANPLDIRTPSAEFIGRLGGATVEPGEPLPDASVQQTLWWKFLPPGAGVLSVTLQTAPSTTWMTVFDGATFASMTPVPASNGSFYEVQPGHEYSLQLASGYMASGVFILDTHFYSNTNDMFVNSARVVGTNLTSEGYLADATFEGAEPSAAATNTVWVSWVAPVTGRASYQLGPAPPGQHAVVYSGSTLAALQLVPTIATTNGDSSFVTSPNTEYHFQICGAGDTYSFSLVLTPLDTCPNDNFVDARPVRGQFFSFQPASVIGATMEPGEPAHMGSQPQKSIWWKWRAPVWGTALLSTEGSFVSNVVMAAYSGDAVEALSLVAKGTNALMFPVSGGQIYDIAGAVETNATGDILVSAQCIQQGGATVHPIPGNLLQEASWEEGWFNVQYWHWSGDLTGYEVAPGGCDGSTWPVLKTGTTIWQDVPTIPGHRYGLRFAYQVGGFYTPCCGAARVQVAWGTNELGVSDIPAVESGFWHWDEYAAIATDTISRVSFENLGRDLEMDAFSLLDLSQPPAIIAQPAPASVPSGGTVAFIVGAIGAPPLRYQWFFDNVPLAGGTEHLLVLQSVSTNQAGNYFVTISNDFGAITSTVVSLQVESPEYPTLVWQPYGDTVAVGGYYGFSVTAIGSPPLSYQWYFNGAPIVDATTRTLVFTNVMFTNAGSYQVTAGNAAGLVWSLPATLTVTTTNAGGATVDFRNWELASVTNEAPVFDLDGMTRLSGPGYLAQLYAGPSLEWLRPAGQPVGFQTGLNAGYFEEEVVTLANVAPGDSMVAQVRAWDSAFGNSYEEARALGGRFGKSEIISTRAWDLTLLYGLEGFNLQAGLPRFTSGRIQFEERQPQGLIVWSVTGEAGYRYLVEKAAQDSVFRPYVVLTNLTGTVTFTDSANSGAAVIMYRARILD